ncbi:AAA family ATPase [Natronosporangium hydrolyticum]|uniref:AAA family ATPase n=1 Tax=Natronosporangium hydrolyticum TaxID=2811111 RepID=A0A895Y7H5_9ACTN|nr:BTAD domain-containing putative transcriptional regulator [Natronosporangium hydrolyticum]QSB13667.1 AAA family ATPase [Natronosporangium hydrolyticum]
MEIALLGPLQIRSATGDLIEVGGRRVRLLVALLAWEAGQPVSHTTLVDRIWPDQPPDRTANALQALVSRARRQLPADAVVSRNGGYQLAVEPTAVDLHQFHRLVEQGRAALPHHPDHAAATLDAALTLWRGPEVLPGLAQTGPLARLVTQLTEVRHAIVEEWADAQLRVGPADPVVPRLAALLAAEPGRERAVGLQMRALSHAGRTGDALELFQRTRTVLAEQLGVDPSPPLTELHRRLLRGAPEPQPATTTTGAQLDGALRADLTSFVGRDQDLTRLAQLLQTRRLCTLTGPGGAGKTRLARAAARDTAHQFPDGVTLVELAPYADPADLPAVVFAALRVRDEGPTALRRTARADSTEPDSTQRLVQALASRRCLLLLDNCEHLVDAVAKLAQHLLSRCPELRILATSREALQVTGEATWPVDPLALPAEQTPAGQALTYPALRLFADRAAAAHPGLRVDETNARTAVRICRALDGMPLAIELAAARLRTMSLSQLASRLDDRFRVLTGGDRTALPRHRTLRAMVDWSWELLDSDEQKLLRRLAGFSGTISQAAAEAVGAGSGLPTAAILDLLTALADKSLLVPTHSDDDQLRFRMLETIRAYGQEKLTEAGEEELVRRAHTDHFLTMAETAEPLLRTGAQVEWLRRLHADADNLHTALRRAITDGDTYTAVRLVAALGWFWALSGRRVEGVALARQALALPGETPDQVRAQAYTVAACTGVEHVYEDTVEEWFRRAAELAARTDNDHPMVRMVGPLYELFTAPSWQPRSWRDRPPLPEQRITHLFDDPDPWVRGTSRIMHLMAALHTGGDPADFAEHTAAAIDAFRLVGDGWGEATARSGSAEIAAIRGDLDTAINENRRALAIIDTLGVHEDRIHFQTRLAELRWLQGDRAAAHATLAESRQQVDYHRLRAARVVVGRAIADLARLDHDLPAATAALAWATGPDDDSYLGTEPAITLSVAHAHLAVAEHDPDTARAYLATAAALLSQGSCAGTVAARVALGHADLALTEGDHTRAAELLGVSEAIRGYRDQSQADAARIEAAAGAGLGEQLLAQARARGNANPDWLGGLTPSEITLAV